MRAFGKFLTAFVVGAEPPVYYAPPPPVRYYSPYLGYIAQSPAPEGVQDGRVPLPNRVMQGVTCALRRSACRWGQNAIAGQRRQPRMWLCSIDKEGDFTLRRSGSGAILPPELDEDQRKQTREII
jgi:hypothetical protein